jgi:hypothetical protein
MRNKKACKVQRTWKNAIFNNNDLSNNKQWRRPWPLLPPPPLCHVLLPEGTLVSPRRMQFRREVVAAGRVHTGTCGRWRWVEALKQLRRQGRGSEGLMRDGRGGGGGAWRQPRRWRTVMGTLARMEILTEMLTEILTEICVLTMARTGSRCRMRVCRLGRGRRRRAARM